MKKRKYSYSLRVGKINARPFEVVKRKLKGITGWTGNALNKRPLTSFFAALLILLGAIIFSNFVLGQKPAVEEKEEVTQEVSTFTIGEVPKVTMQGQVEKSNVIKIISQTSGVVQSVNFLEGSFVEKGSVLANLSSNYAGGNAPSLSRQLAGIQYENIKSTYDAQKEIIKKSREIAEKGDTQSDELRNISNESISRTNEIIDLNSQILESISDDLKNDPNSRDLKGLKSQYLSANNQLRSALKTTENSTLDDSESAQISNLQKEITLKNLEILEKGLNLSRESARLQLALAQVSEGFMYPSAPFSATIQRVHVRVGESINPGTPLITLAGDRGTANVYVKVSEKTAKSISKLEPSTLYIGNEALSLYPDFISSEATDGNMNVIHFFVPEDYASLISDKSFVRVKIPIGYPDTSSSIPFIPIDSVFQGQEQAFIYVLKGGKAVSKKVELGEVFGSFVEVKNGVETEDEIILSRSIISGQKLKKIGI